MNNKVLEKVTKDIGLEGLNLTDDQIKDCFLVALHSNFNQARKKGEEFHKLNNQRKN